MQLPPEIDVPSIQVIPTAIEVERVPVPGLDPLAFEWRDLQARADHSFFISWAWIGAWLAALPDAVPRSLVRVRAGGRTVGLAIACDRTLTRARYIRSRALVVNCTGDPELDELTIEYNGFLIERGLERSVYHAILQFLLRDHSWDELMLRGWRDADLVAEVAAALRLQLATQKVRPSYLVEFDSGCASSTGYVDALPARVRYKVRRSLREAERLGEIELTVATTPGEAGRFLAELKVLHQRSWTSRGQAGSFADPFFDRFHSQFVSEGGGERAGAVQVLRVSIGNVPIGYLYNFVYSGRVYNYQSGFDFDRDPSAHWRPGLLSHVKCIEFNRAAGMRSYDFLAGHQAHKRELGTRSNELIWTSIQRPRWRFQVERWLRALKKMAI